jgi:uncharacterized membrane protein YfcA
MTATEGATTTAVRGSRWLVRAAVLGLVAGFLGGLFGVGGGILIVPALVLFMHMDQRLAHGTSLAAVLPIAIASLIGYTLADKVDWPVGALLAIGAVGGAVIGTHILHVLPQRVLGYVFAGFLLLTAIRLVVDHASALGRSELTVGRAGVLVLIGLVTGILAGLLGVGGGIVMVPAMIVLFGIPAVVAKGTSLAVIVPTAVMGTWRNRTKHNTDLHIAAVVGVAGIVSAFAASQVSVGLSETTSNVLFALLLTVVAVRMLWQFRTERRALRAADTADAAEATAG